MGLLRPLAGIRGPSYLFRLPVEDLDGSTPLPQSYRVPQSSPKFQGPFPRPACRPSAWLRRAEPLLLVTALGTPCRLALDASVRGDVIVMLFLLFHGPGNCQCKSPTELPNMLLATNYRNL